MLTGTSKPGSGGQNPGAGATEPGVVAPDGRGRVFIAQLVVAADIELGERNEVRAQPLLDLLRREAGIVQTVLQVGERVFGGDGAIRPPGDERAVHRTIDFVGLQPRRTQPRVREQMVVFAILHARPGGWRGIRDVPRAAVELRYPARPLC